MLISLIEPFHNVYTFKMPCCTQQIYAILSIKNKIKNSGCTTICHKFLRITILLYILGLITFYIHADKIVLKIEKNLKGENVLKIWFLLLDKLYSK